jgi:hypothetical protein
MRHLLIFLLAVVSSCSTSLAEHNPEPIRLCVAVLENDSHSIPSPKMRLYRG